MLPGIKLFDMRGKTAVVTGGTKGLGLAIAEALASAGADVLLVGRNAEDAKAAALKVATDYQVQGYGFGCDVSDSRAVDALAAYAAEIWPKVDVLVNSAGINIRGPIDKLTFEEFRRVQAVNVEGTWLCCKAFVPRMKERRSGRIVNLASTLGLVGLADRTPYTSSKGAVVQMTRGLGLELAPFGITANAICPGPFLTEMNIPIKDDENTKKFIVGAVALGRWGDLHEIQGAALYLASDASSYTTGSMLVVDGGWTAR